VIAAALKVGAAAALGAGGVWRWQAAVIDVNAAKPSSHAGTAGPDIPMSFP